MRLFQHCFPLNFLLTIRDTEEDDGMQHEMQAAIANQGPATANVGNSI